MKYPVEPDRVSPWVALGDDRPTHRDSVNSPPHYNRGGIECIDAIEAAVKDLAGPEAVLTANALKYLWRWKDKGGVEDLRKARWYIDRLIKRQT